MISTQPPDLLQEILLLGHAAILKINAIRLLLKIPPKNTCGNFGDHQSTLLLHLQEGDYCNSSQLHRKVKGEGHLDWRLRISNSVCFSSFIYLVKGSIFLHEENKEIGERCSGK